MSRGPDLRLAVRRGFFVLSVPGLGGVRIRTRAVIEYDPALPRAERVPLVCAVVRGLGRGPRSRVSAGGAAS